MLGAHLGAYTFSTFEFIIKINLIDIERESSWRTIFEQVRLIVERCEQKYGYKPELHQRVIVEHVKDGRQHFHVIWNRVSLKTGKAVWPGHHWKKSKQVAREMERELGLKRPTPKRILKKTARYGMAGRYAKHGKPYPKKYTKGSHGSHGKGLKGHRNGNSQPRPWCMSKAGLNAVHTMRYRQSADAARHFPIRVSQQADSHSRKIGKAEKFWNAHSPLSHRTGRKPNLYQSLKTLSFGGGIGVWLLPVVAGTPMTQHQATNTNDQVSSASPMPHRPAADSGMCEAQRTDYLAACEGKITSRQYFTKWGRSGLGL